MDPENPRAPAASLGLLDATTVGIGAMIGAGIFVLTGLVAEIAGPAALLVFGRNGGVTTGGPPERPYCPPASGTTWR